MKDLNIRAKPGTETKIINWAKKGEELKIVDNKPINVDGINWIKIIKNGKEGLFFFF
jgi:uncharacterized protein YgiM (DUF1202 family)